MIEKFSKKTFKKGLFCCIAVFLFFSSCTKDEIINNLLKPIFAEQSVTDTTKTIVGADCDGLAQGFKEGAEIGANIHQGLSFFVAVGYSVVRGVQHSVEQGKINRMERNSSTQIPVENMLSEAGNTNNPYDSIGLIHYLMIDYLFDNQDSWYSENSGIQNYQFFNLAVNLLQQYYPSLNGWEQCCTNQTFVNSMNNPVESFTSLLPDFISDQTLRSILTTYRIAFEGCENFETFYDYSISVENQISDDNSYTNWDKQKALSYMATMRYGLWYWSFYASAN